MRVLTALALVLALAGSGEGGGEAAGTALPVVAVTSADGAEGHALTLALLERRGVGAAGSVIAIVASKSSAASQQLAGAGALLRQQPSAGPPPPALFAGAAWTFFLAPLTPDRLARTTALIESAVSAAVPNALLLSVVDGHPSHGPDNTTAIGSYFALEAELKARWRGGQFTVLRTFFYQQNLLLWARDAVATDELRLPLSATAGCFAPLFEADVVRVDASRWPCQRASGKCVGGAHRPSAPAIRLAKSPSNCGAWKPRL